MSKGIEVVNHDKQQSHWYDAMGDVLDGYHTFNELYAYRKAYNAALFNEWAAQKKYKVHKSRHHADDPYAPIFGGGWFVVVAELPTGQISNHYEEKDWEAFHIPEAQVAHAWDGHTPQVALERLEALYRDADEVTLCPDCNCMTHTNRDGFCGKCGADKIDEGETI